MRILRRPNGRGPRLRRYDRSWARSAAGNGWRCGRWRSRPQGPGRDDAQLVSATGPTLAACSWHAAYSSPPRYAAEQPLSSAGPREPQNGTVARPREIPMLGHVTAEAPRPDNGNRDLAAAGIGLLASPTEAAQAAEKMLRRRYQWATTDEATTL